MITSLPYNQKKTGLLLLFLCLFCFCTAQQKALSISSSQNDKTVIIPEGKRVRVLTIDRQRISGRLEIVDSETIVLKSGLIPLSEIVKIKRNPLLLSLLLDGLALGYGFFGIFASIIGAGFTENAWILGFIAPSSGLIYSGMSGINFLKGYKQTEWSYKIIDFYPEE